MGAFKKWEGYAASNTGTRVVVEVAAHELQAETSKVPGWVRRLGITITEGWNTVKMFCAGRREGNRLAQIEKTFDMWVAENDSQASALAADSTETKEDPSSRGELSVFEEKKPGAEGMGDLLASSDCEAQVIEIHGEERGKKKGPPPPPISAFRAGQTQKAGVTETGKSRPLTKRPEHEGQGVAAGKKKVPPPTPPKNYPVAHKTGGLGAQEVEGRPIVTKVPWSRGKGKPESPPPDEEVSEDDAWSD